MSFRHTSRAIVLLGLLLVSLAAFALSDPWSDAQTVQPAALSSELTNPKTAPTVLFVGFGRLYTAGHIKGAQYRGTAGNEDGLKQLRSSVESLPRGTDMVIYCGCCPMERCPNIRPAFAMLRDMGFTKARVLILPTDFEKDWAEKGFPYDKGQ